jgi:hypothetical protein
LCKEIVDDAQHTTANHRHIAKKTFCSNIYGSSAIDSLWHICLFIRVKEKRFNVRLNQIPIAVQNSMGIHHHFS